MRIIFSLLLVALQFVAVGLLQAGESALTQARRGFATHLVREEKVGVAPDQPPLGVLDLVAYKGPLGAMAAYVSSSPKDGKRHPAIIWLVGGFSNSIGDIAWTPGPPEDDQSASGFREASIIMMYPSLRGGNMNPGFRETFYGEVDDVIAAARFLAQLDYVDPKRIYLGGHSTGGTLALLIAASTDQFRAVFSLGPAGNALGYGSDVLPFDTANPKEAELRAPRLWLDSIHSRTFVFEGNAPGSNIGELRAMAVANRNPVVTFRPIPGGTHFSIIAPLIREISQRILEDDGETLTMDFKILRESGYAGTAKERWGDFERFFAKLLEDHGEKNVVRDGRGVGLDGNPTRLRASVYGNKKTRDGSSSVELEIRVSLPGGREIVDYVSGVGKTEDQAVNDGLANFTLSTFHVVYKVFLNASDPHLNEEEIVIDGIPRQAVIGPVVWRGKPGEPGAFEPALKRAIAASHLPAGLHWIKIVYGQHNDAVLAVAVTVDNQDDDELTAAIRRINWPKSPEFYLLKQFLLVR